MKNLQVYQLMRLITIILPITDHTVIYIILKESHSLSVQAIPWASETFERCTGIFNSRQVSHGNVHY